MWIKGAWLYFCKSEAFKFYGIMESADALSLDPGLFWESAANHSIDSIWATECFAFV